MNSTGSAGKVRDVWFVLVLSVVTLGLYYLYWTFKSFEEVRRWRSEGVNPWIGTLLNLTLIGNFLLASYVGRMYKEEQEELIARGEDPLLVGKKVPITGWSGLFALIPPWPLGELIWLGIVQSKLNNFWEAKGVSATVAESSEGEPAS